MCNEKTMHLFVIALKVTYKFVIAALKLSIIRNASSSSPSSASKFLSQRVVSPQRTHS